jgi:hypothetical protein
VCAYALIGRLHRRAYTQEEQAELLGAISSEGPDVGLAYVGLEPPPPHTHLTSAELDQRDILYGSAFTPGGSSETHGNFLLPQLSVPTGN